MSIIERIKKQKLKKISRSINISERNEQIIKNKSEVVKDLMGSTNELDKHVSYANQLSYHYYKMLHEYNTYTFVSLVKPVPNKRGESYWNKVAERCLQAEVSPEKYIKAQFVYFNKHFNKSPEHKHLITEEAVKRAKTVSSIQDRVVSDHLPSNVDLGTLFSECEKMIRRLCRAQNISREEFYRNFVIPGIITIPKQFLQADPVYKAIIKGS